MVLTSCTENSQNGVVVVEVTCCFQFINVLYYRYLQKICDAYEASDHYKDMMMELKPMHDVSASNTVQLEVKDFEEHSQ